MQFESPQFNVIFEMLNREDMSKEIKKLQGGRSGREFELFVMYVFERAGFSVRDVAQRREIPGIDCVLSDPRTSQAYAHVQAKQFSTTVGVEFIRDLGGVVPPDIYLKRILIASNIFSPDAYTQAEQYVNFLLIDIHHLVRYIRFIRGSRYPDDHMTLLPPTLLFESDAVIRRSPSMTTVLALANDKGGVGKTTSVINIGTLLAERGANVLVVDNDPQANLTRRMGFKGMTANGKERTLTDYFFGKYALPEIIRPTNFPRLWVLPSAHNANLAAKGVHEWPQRTLTFAKDLHATTVAPPPYHAEKFDWILIDTPTADEYRIRLALAAAHFVLAPALPSSFAAFGLQILFDSVDTMQGLMGQYVDLMGCFLTQCSSINNRIKELLGDTLDALKIRNVQLFETTIPRSPSIETAHLKQKSLFGRSVLSAIARAYDNLVEKEIKLYVNSYTTT